MIPKNFVLSSFLVLTLVACMTSKEDRKDAPPNENIEKQNLEEKITLEDFFPNLQFRQPLLMLNSPEDSDIFYVVEQRGIIQKIRKSTEQKTIFSDFREYIPNSRGEMGLLGMALSPEFSQNGEFFVSYTTTNPIRLVVSRVNIQNPNQPEIVLEIEKEFEQYSNHNGGMIVFGPDQFLYVGVGDGGGAGDRRALAQNRSQLWGSILRIDVSTPDRYQIPPSNPYVGASNIREEIWAYGLRNPWRFSFDRKSQQLFLADVGQNRAEEINITQKGDNLGWNYYEASFPFHNPEDIPFQNFKAPIWEYEHNLGRSITGGFVYRGQNIPELNRHYVYGDYVSGRFWALELSENLNVIANHDLGRSRNISSFAEDNDGELYLISYSNGKIFKIVPKDNSH